MSPAADGFVELREILEALCEERLTAAQTVRLEELALHDTAARRYYLEYIELHGNLHWDAAQGRLAGEHEVLFAEEEPEPTPRSRRSWATPACLFERDPRNVRAAVASSVRPGRRRRRRDCCRSCRGGLDTLAFQGRSLKSRPPSPLNITSSRPSAGARRRGGRSAATVGERAANSADAAQPKTSASSTRPIAANVAAHRRPARFQLAVARNNGPASKASLLPLDLNSSPIHAPHVPSEPPAASGASDDGQQGPASPVAFIDARLRSGWKSSGIEPSPIATDEEWIRRVYLDVVGHIPPEEAVDAFLNNDGDDKYDGNHKRAGRRRSAFAGFRLRTELGDRVGQPPGGTTAPDARRPPRRSRKSSSATALPPMSPGTKLFTRSSRRKGPPIKIRPRTSSWRISTRTRSRRRR